MNTENTSFPKTRTILYPLILVNLLFFMWGFIWNLANVLVALFKETFELNNSQTSLLTSISFLAFFALSYPAKYIIEKLKTKNSIVLGAGILIRVKPGRLVGWFAAVTSILIIISMLTQGYVAIYSIVFTGFFISIMFATVYSLAIEGLGRFTNEASSFLVMAISGGFFIPLLYGVVADYFSLKTSLIIVIIPLLLVSWYGFFRARQK